jgi:hypothetical protein
VFWTKKIKTEDRKEEEKVDEDVTAEKGQF